MAEVPVRGVVVAAADGDVGSWAGRARQVEERGFGSLVCPDVPGRPDPVPYLAAAAAATSALRVGTWVTSVAWHLPRSVARTAATLARLSGGRFDLGLGTGRRADDALLRAWGPPSVDATDRRRRIAETIRLVRSDAVGISIVVAASGPRAIALGATHADVVALAVGPATSWAEARCLADRVAAVAAEHDRTVGVALNLAAVGDHVPAWQARGGLGVADLRAADAVAVLPAEGHAALAVVQRMRAELGLTHLVVAEELAPHLPDGILSPP